MEQLNHESVLGNSVQGSVYGSAQSFNGNYCIETPLPVVYRPPRQPMFSLPFLASGLKDFVFGIQIDSVVYMLEQLYFHGTEYAGEVMEAQSQEVFFRDEDLYIDFPTLDHMWSIWKNREDFGQMVALLQTYGISVDGMSDVFYLIRDEDYRQKINGDCINPVSGTVWEADTRGYYKSFCEVRHKISGDYAPISFLDEGRKFRWDEFCRYFQH